MISVDLVVGPNDSGGLFQMERLIVGLLFLITGQSMKRQSKKLALYALQRANRFWKRPNWKNMRTIAPLSRSFGLDRGQAIDRYYIEKFLSQNASHIKGNVLEVAENTYTKQFGRDVQKSDVLHISEDAPGATIIGDLCDLSTLPENAFDCFICTQTYNFIYDFQSAIRGTRYLLRNGGIVLATVAGISQISRYDMDRWGDFWRFTTLSVAKIFSEQFGEANVQVSSFGNVLTSIGFLEGLSAGELSSEELEYNDPDYQLLITVVAKKNPPQRDER